MISFSILVGLFFLVVLLLFFPLRIRFSFVGAKKNSLIEIRFFKWKFFTTKDESFDESTESDVSSGARDSSKKDCSVTESNDDVIENSNSKSDSNISENINKDDADTIKKDVSEEMIHSVESSYPCSKKREDMRRAVMDTSEKAENDDVNDIENIGLTDALDDDEATKSGDFSTESEKIDENVNRSTTEIEEDDVSESIDSKSTKKKRTLSEKEFLTLMFNPKLHSMALRMAWKLLRHAWRLFTIRFDHTVVQGIRMEYDEMGFGAILTTLLTSQLDMFKNWDIQMDWLKEKELEIRGSILIQFKMFFFLIWSLIALFYAARVYFWYRQNKKRFIENPLPFRLVFWRRKIIDLIAAED